MDLLNFKYFFEKLNCKAVHNVLVINVLQLSCDVDHSNVAPFQEYSIAKLFTLFVFNLGTQVISGNPAKLLLKRSPKLVLVRLKKGDELVFLEEEFLDVLVCDNGCGLTFNSVGAIGD